MLNRVNYILRLILWFLYYGWKFLGISTFSIGRKYKTVRSSLVSTILCVLVCISITIVFIFLVIENVKIHNDNIPELLLKIILMTSRSLVFITIIVLLLTQLLQKKGVVRVIHGAFKNFEDVQNLTRNQNVLSKRYFLFVLIRLLFNLIKILWYFGTGWCFCERFLLIIYIKFVISFVLNTLCIGAVIVLAEFEQLGKYLDKVNVEMCENSEPIDQLYYSVQIEEFIRIVQNLSQSVEEFKRFFQLPVLVILYNSLLLAVLSFFYSYFSSVVWKDLLFSTIEIHETLLILLLAELIKKKYINYGKIFGLFKTNGNQQLNRSTEQFHLYLKLKELHIDVFGLFELKNNLSMAFLSTTVTYIIILFQSAVEGNITLDFFNTYFGTKG